jgi:hypothetical protein
VPLKATGECLEPFDLVLTVEILLVTWHDVWPGNELGFRLVKITQRRRNMAILACRGERKERTRQESRDIARSMMYAR